MRRLRSAVVNGGKNVAALAIGLIFTLGSLEGGARIFASLVGVSPYMRYHEVFGWAAMPGAVKRHKNASLDFDVTYRVNDEGQRGRLYPKAKPAGVYRIVVLGDSNGFGWGIDEGSHFAALLDAAEAIEVVNLSLSGYGTDQELLRLEAEGFSYEPDLVILQMTDNDLEEIQYPFFNQKPKPQFVLTGDGALELVNVPVAAVGAQAEEFFSNSLPLPFREWLGWHSYSFNWLNEKYHRLRQQRAAQGTPMMEEPTSESRVTLMRRLVQRIQQRLDEHHVQGLVVHAAKEMSERHVLPSEGLPVLDLWPAFEEYRRRSSVSPTFADGIHWNVIGHRMMAEAVLERIRIEPMTRTDVPDLVH